MGNRRISTKFWSDAYIENLGKNGKLLYLYLLTNGESNIAGVYECTIKRMAADTDLSKDEVNACLTQFVRDGKISYVSGSWVIMHNHPKHQEYRTSKNTRLGIERILAEAPDEVLCEAYHAGYKYDFFDAFLEERGISCADTSPEASDEAPTKDHASPPKGPQGATKPLEGAPENGIDLNTELSEMDDSAYDNVVSKPLEGATKALTSPLQAPRTTYTYTNTYTSKEEELNRSRIDSNASASEQVELSAMKDPLANEIQSLFIEQYPPSSWSNFAKERKQLNTIARKVRQLLADVPFESESELFEAMLAAFLNLRARHSGKPYWTCAVIPSAFVQRWSEIVTELSKQFEQQKAIKRGIEQAKEAAKEDVLF